jgi:hypothetical protein
MENEFMRRGFLLPEGCKDLIDALHLKAELKLRSLSAIPPDSIPFKPIIPLPKIKGEITVPQQMAVRELAALLNCKPFVVVADAMELGVFATVNQIIPFDIIAQIARKHGYTARPIDNP